MPQNTQFFIGITASFFGGLLLALLGYSWRGIDLCLRKRQFLAFWGKEALFSSDVFLVLDVVHDLRLLGAEPTQNRFYKIFPNEGRIDLPGPFEPMSTASARAVSYISSAFASARKEPPKTVSDEDIWEKWEGTFVCFGSSSSNIKTREILQLEENEFSDFVVSQRNGQPEPAIKTKWDGKIFFWGHQPERDFGLIVKLPNPRFPGHTLTVCAGLAEYGTSGSAFYLARHWRQLHKRYKDRSFALVVEVAPRSDESATEIAGSPANR